MLHLEDLYSIILPSSSHTWLSFVYPVFVHWSFNLAFSILAKLLLVSSVGWCLKVYFSPISNGPRIFFLFFGYWNRDELRLRSRTEISSKPLPWSPGPTRGCPLCGCCWPCGHLWLSKSRGRAGGSPAGAVRRGRAGISSRTHPPALPRGTFGCPQRGPRGHAAHLGEGVRPVPTCGDKRKKRKRNEQPFSLI